MTYPTACTNARISPGKSTLETSKEDVDKSTPETSEEDVDKSTPETSEEDVV